MAVELVQEIDIDLLQDHPRNVEIYGDEDVTDLQQSIRESGWVKPLTVTPAETTGQYVVVAGHRRKRAAKEEGYTKLPVVIEVFASPEAEMERLLRENENRGKTPEQQIREGMTWEPIEEIRRDKRLETMGKATGRGNKKDTENFPEPLESGEVRNIIARRVGLGSGVTYEKGKEVVLYMDRMYLIGSERGDILKMTLNDESINAASKLMKKYTQKDDEIHRRQEEELAEAARQQELRHQRYLEAVTKAEHCQLYHCSVANNFAVPSEFNAALRNCPSITLAFLAGVGYH